MGHSHRLHDLPLRKLVRADGLCDLVVGRALQGLQGLAFPAVSFAQEGRVGSASLFDSFHYTSFSTKNKEKERQRRLEQNGLGARHDVHGAPLLNGRRSTVDDEVPWLQQKKCLQLHERQTSQEGGTTYPRASKICLLQLQSQNCAST